MGLYADRPKPWEKKARPAVLSEKERALSDIEWFEDELAAEGRIAARGEALPAIPLDKMTLPELTYEAGTLAIRKLVSMLRKDREIRNPDGSIMRPMDVRTERLEMDLAQGTAKIFMRVHEAALRGQQNDKLQQILDAMNAIEAEAVEE